MVRGENMDKKELIQNLIKLGWTPIDYLEPEERYYHLWKQFEVSKSNELQNYTNYTPKENELIFILYEIYPNIEQVRYCLWSSNDLPGDVIYEEDSYENVLELALADRLFTYPQRIQQGCKFCKHNRKRTVRQKECKKGYRAVYGFGCREYESIPVGYQLTIYDIMNDEQERNE